MVIYMSLIFDAAVLLIVAGVTYFGMKKGLLRTVFGTISYIASLILAAVIYKPIGGFVANSELTLKINTAMNDKITQSLSKNTDELPLFLKGFAEDGIQNIAQSLSDTLTSAVVFIVCAIIIFLVIKIFLKFSDGTTKLIKKVKLINGADKLLGTVFGFVNGILIVCIVLFLCMLFLNGEHYETFTSSVNGSYIAKFFYDNNILMSLVMKYL